MIFVPDEAYEALLEDRRTKRLLEVAALEMLEAVRAGDLIKLPAFVERLRDILEDAE